MEMLHEGFQTWVGMPRALLQSRGHAPDHKEANVVDCSVLHSPGKSCCLLRDSISVLQILW